MLFYFSHALEDSSRRSSFFSFLFQLVAQTWHIHIYFAVTVTSQLSIVTSCEFMHAIIERGTNFFVPSVKQNQFQVNTFC